MCGDNVSLVHGVHAVTPWLAAIDVVAKGGLTNAASNVFRP